MEDYLLLGKIVKPHGLKGEVKIFSKTDFAEIRYKKDRVVFLHIEDKYIPLKVETFFKQGLFDVVSFQNYQDINLIKDFLGKEVYIKKQDATLPDNYFHFVDLISCSIISENKEIGKVIEVLDYPANYCLKCTNKNNKYFVIPFVDEFILNVDIKNKKINVKLIKGIL